MSLDAGSPKDELVHFPLGTGLAVHLGPFGDHRMLGSQQEGPPLWVQTNSGSFAHSPALQVQLWAKPEGLQDSLKVSVPLPSWVTLESSLTSYFPPQGYGESHTDSQLKCEHQSFCRESALPQIWLTLMILDTILAIITWQGTVGATRLGEKRGWGNGI